MKVIIGSDHGGFNLKSAIIDYLAKLGYETVDIGTHTTNSCDYPYIASELSKKVLEENSLGILVCGTGIGMSIAANKHDGIRAACCSDIFSARLTREHNDANILCLGERVVGVGLALDLVDAFVNATYMNSGNHVTRVAMLKDIEEGKFN
jgi:ribose 5-phosphate isomerase B